MSVFRIILSLAIGLLCLRASATDDSLHEQARFPVRTDIVLISWAGGADSNYVLLTQEKFTSIASAASSPHSFLHDTGPDEFQKRFRLLLTTKQLYDALALLSPGSIITWRESRLSGTEFPPKKTVDGIMEFCSRNGIKLQIGDSEGTPEVAPKAGR